MDLLIVESGAKSKTIQKYLGKEYVVMACGGHVEDLPQSKNATWPYSEGELPKPAWGWTKGAEKTVGNMLKLSLIHI